MLLVVTPVLFSCNKSEDELEEIREIAWNSLTEREKESVTIDWEDAVIESGTYENNEVHMVRFNTTDDPLLGPIVVYVDKNNKKVLGQLLRH